MLEAIEKKCSSNVALLRGSTELKMQLDQDIRQLVTRRKNLEKIEVKVEFDPEVITAALNLPGDMDADVNVKSLWQRLINDTLNVDMQVVRGRSKRPGLVKAQDKDLNDKKRMLRAPMLIKLYMNRLQELNINALLQELPNGHY